ncbi:CheR family methyltransferase [Aporhodopirellula aestuarii]|uniref:PAS domain S-box protein n=1 Tax=Aporhodopirellula aestuarii TaxID=2950107 RepID=A0ABT0UAD7_9BACT|nr:CheR family methyltransferase [Aporhodopirellula aestuarii]MCM2373480.1 PAS domain S-box protein [Aporhodopirellula aestuarii]
MKHATAKEPEHRKTLLVVGVGFGIESWDLVARVVNEYSANRSDDTAAGETEYGECDPHAAVATVLSLAVTPNGSEGCDDNEQAWSRESKIENLTVVHRNESVDLQPGGVYIAEAGRALQVRDGSLVAVELPADKQNAPIDHLFGSLADQVGELAVGVILSGGGTDGTQGLRSISDAGGMTIAQRVDSASNRSMPQAASALGVVDHVLSPDQIADEIRIHTQHMHETDERDDVSDLNRKIIVAIPQIASAVEKHTQNDFKHYKTTTLARRIRRRIHVLKLPSVDAYVELLQASRDETLQLFRDLLISVTAFFRDPRAFDSLASMVLEPLVDQHQSDSPIRVWVPGCATGQEAYSIAILMAEVIEKSGRDVTFQIFATDLDERALSIARAGGYPIGIQDEVSPERLSKFFTKRGNRYFVNKKLRDTIVFSAHNLISDPPFTKLDLVSCRNLLIYLGSHLQKKLIPLFHYATKPGGFLFLGPAESLSVNRELFRTLDQKHRLFQRRVTAIDPAATVDLPRVNLSRFSRSVEDDAGEFDLFRYAQQIVLGEFSPQWAVVDDDGEIQTLSSDPSPFLQMTSGKFQNNIIAMAHDNVRIGLRAAFADAKRHRRRALAEDMSIPVDGGIQRVHITVQPMPQMGEEASLHLVAFHRIGTPLEVNGDQQIESNGNVARADDRTVGKVIEQLELELSRTRNALERTVQELETSNEELKSSNEELLSMNEELQSANEELEASKEELQAANETLIRANNDTANLLRSTQIATIFLDKDLRIRGFTPAATKIYSLVESDVGRQLTKFASEIEDMPPLPDVANLGDDQVKEQLVGSVNGRTYLRRVIPYRSTEGENDGIVVTFSDVTEISESESLIRTIAENSTNALIMMNDHGYLTYCNQAMLDMFGFSAEELRQKPLHDIIHHHYPDGRPYPMSQCPIDRALPEDFSVRAHEDLFFRKDGSTVPVLCAASPIFKNGKPVSTVIEVRDITKQKNDEEELRSREAHLRRILDGTLCFVGVLDLEGRLVEANDPALRSAGVTREEVIGLPFAETVWWNFDDRVKQQVNDAIALVASGGSFREDLRYQVAGKIERWVDFSLNPVFDHDGTVAFMIPSGFDITDRYEIEARLEQARAAAEAASESKSAFLANMSHEIRTPMTAILGYADLIAEKVGDQETASYVDTIRRNGGFLLEIINDILDLSKIEAGKLDVSEEIFSPRQLIEDVQSIMGVRAKEGGIELSVEFHSQVPSLIMSDTKRLKQILINLVGNAIKFTPEGSVDVAVSHSGEMLRVEITDTGIGMSEQHLENLFQPFSQGDGNVNREFGGTGLGLAISRRLAEILGGQITVTSELGRGSTFTVDVRARPIVGRADASTEESQASSDKTLDAKSVRLECDVLVVDDRRDIRFLSRSILQRAGATVEEAEDGEVAIAVVKERLERSRPFGLIVLDMQMPRLDGYATAKILRELGYVGPIIALTADAMQGDMKRCLEAGCNDYLSKPIDSAILLRKSGELLRG